MAMDNKAITSRSNAAFKWLQEIATNPRARREHQASWLEGERLCEAYLQSDALLAIAVMAQPKSEGAAFLASRYGHRIRETWQLDAKLFTSISSVETPVGWGLVIPIPPSADLAGDGDVVVLDRIQDPGNLGTVLRSAAGAGVRHAWCTSGTTDPWSPKALRSAMGAHFVMKIAVNVTDQQAIDAARSRKARLLATALTEDSASIFSPALKLQEPCVWVFGNEAGGVSKSLLGQAQRIMIPQSKEVESLNVAAAASVCLFEMRRRRL